jgi:hypothetical protein
MKHARYSLVIGAILAAGAFGAIQMNAAVGQAGEGVVPRNATDTGGDPAAAGNFTVTEEGLGNGTEPASIPTPVDTTQLKMHIDAANTAMQSNDTQAATHHIILALEEVEMILGGNATSTANATDMMSNMTMTDDMTMNSTGMP